MRINYQPRIYLYALVCKANDAMNSNRVYIAIFVTRVYYRSYSLTLRVIWFTLAFYCAPLRAKQTPRAKKRRIMQGTYIYTLVFLAHQIQQAARGNFITKLINMTVERN